MPFAAKPGEREPETSPVEGFLPLAKWVALGLALLAFLFFVVRHLRRQEQATLADPDWLRELSQPVPVAELGFAAPPVPVPAPAPTADDTRLARVRQTAERDPDRIAQQVRAWMNDD